MGGGMLRIEVMDLTTHLIISLTKSIPTEYTNE